MSYVDNEDGTKWIDDDDRTERTRSLAFTFIVNKIDDQGDRILLYGHETFDDYYVIAGTGAGSRIKVGDRITYEPDGWNFGWLIKGKP